MEWTPDKDARLTELFKKRLDMRFMSSWTHWPAPAIRARLLELGLTKPHRVAAIVAHAAKAPSETAPLVQACELADIEEVEDDEEMGDLRASRGCPRGHLISEAKISALYRTVGRDYR
jgi:hypothetical protein